VSNEISLPSGVKVGVGRETAQTNGQGAIVQGIVFPITLADGTTTTVFVPYTELNDTAKVQADIAARVNAIKAITG
jgi:hypothetical protein